MLALTLNRKQTIRISDRKTGKAICDVRLRANGRHFLSDLVFEADYEVSISRISDKPKVKP